MFCHNVLLSILSILSLNVSAEEQSLSLFEPYKNATCQSFLGKEQKERDNRVGAATTAGFPTGFRPPTHTGQTAFPCRFAFSLSQLFGQIIFHEIWAMA